MGSVIHCTASASPVGMALASEHRISGPESVMAVIIAIEIDATLGGTLGGVFEQLGFHPISSVGTFGAAVSAVRLLGGEVDDAMGA